jgi:hypothetical protein
MMTPAYKYCQVLLSYLEYHKLAPFQKFLVLELFT